MTQIFILFFPAYEYLKISMYHIYNNSKVIILSEGRKTYTTT